MYVSKHRPQSWQSFPSLFRKKLCSDLFETGVISQSACLRAISFFPKPVLCTAEKLIWSRLETIHKALNSELAHYFDRICSVKRVSHSPSYNKAWFLIYTPSYFFFFFFAVDNKADQAKTHK